MNNKPFEIGLALSGTASAGAYSAGVIDFILDALDEWQEIKNNYKTAHGDHYDRWDVPWHDILITGISGSSGGGRICAILLDTLGRDIGHVRTPQPAGTVSNNDIYTQAVEAATVTRMLEVDDLDNQKTVKSLLNSGAIAIKSANLLNRSGFGNKFVRSYISAHLKAIITVTNLRGIPYFLRTKGVGATQIVYKRNSDYLKFELSSDNEHHYPDALLIPYDTSQQAFNASYDQLIAVAQATVAMPVAFAPQALTLPDSVYRLRKNVKELAIPVKTDFDFLGSDGGILNDDPFELLHQDMLPAGETQNPRTADKVERTIILIAPLDTDMKFDSNYDLQKDNLADTAVSVVTAIRSQAIFETEDIELAFDESVFSRFIIAPVRYDQKSDQPVTPAITGTSVANFGAFLSIDFREHDYFLGRRNAQQFLRRHFAIPTDELKNNPLFTQLNIEQNKERFRMNGFVFKDETDGIDYFTLIPLAGKAADKLYDPAWPKGKYDKAKINKQVSTRSDQLIDTFLENLKLNFFVKIIKSLILKSIKSKVSAFLTDSIQKDLKKNDLTD
jgi:hypothetical protein